MKIIMSKIISGLALILALNQAHAAPRLDHHALAEVIQHYLATQGKREGASAMSVSVAAPHAPIVTAFVQDKWLHQPAAQPLFQIGSITKSFIAAIILQLEADTHYHFNINEKLDRFFPQYPKWKNIKIKNLLDMTSGIPDIFSNDQLLQIYLQHPLQKQRIDVWLNILYARNLLFAPGTQYNYSNTNYFLLGRIIEHVTGHDLIRKRQAKTLCQVFNSSKDLQIIFHVAKT
jgi:D-alanyl-D-alanine carboxypeptidase